MNKYYERHLDEDIAQDFEDNCIELTVYKDVETGDKALICSLCNPEEYFYNDFEEERSYIDHIKNCAVCKGKY